MNVNYSKIRKRTPCLSKHIKTNTTVKCLFYIMVVLMLPLLAIRMYTKDDDYYTQAMVTPQVPDTITPIEMQGTVVLKNLSNGRRSYTVSTFQKPLPPLTCGCEEHIWWTPKVPYDTGMADGTEGVKYHSEAAHENDVTWFVPQSRYDC